MGEEMYVLHDNGRHLFTSARDCTPIQRFVYVFAKDHHTDDDHADPDPSGLDKSQQFNQANPL
jgi:hypothetical protein